MTQGRVRILYRHTGTATFTVPAGVTSIEVQCWGGGGGGGVNGLTGGGAGGGGGYGRGVHTVTPGNTHNVNVGTGGAITVAGSNTVFRNATDTADLVVGNGGGAGLNGGAANQGAGGAGGGGTGNQDTNTGGSGGGGAAGQTGGGGGGGGAGAAAAGNGSAGTSGGDPGAGGAAGSPAADRPAGGIGGDGADAFADATVGILPGGGGGGASTLNSAGVGANGQVMITFDFPTSGTGGTTDSVTPADANTRTVAFIRTAADTATASDANVRAVGFNRAAADSVTAADTIVKRVGLFPADIQSVVDAIASKAIGKSLVDVSIATDNFTRLVSYNRAFADSVTAADTIAKHIHVFLEDDLGAAAAVRRTTYIFDD